jgi:hypothetical protein
MGVSASWTLLASVSVALALCGVERPCLADCADSYEQTQRLRQAGKLKRAEQEAIACAEEHCASWIRKDCAQWLEDLRTAMPSIVVRAIGPDGCDLESAVVSVDDERARTGLDGKSIPLDPGTHIIRVETLEGSRVEQKVVIVEGEKARMIVASFAPSSMTCRPIPAGPSSPLPPEVARIDQPRDDKPSMVVPLAIWGVGAVFGTIGGVLEIVSWSRRAGFDRCSPACDPGEVRSWQRTWRIGDAALGASLVALAVGAYFFFTLPSASDDAQH